MEIRRSYDRLISTMGFPILVRWHLYIESGPWCFRGKASIAILLNTQPCISSCLGAKTEHISQSELTRNHHATLLSNWGILTLSRQLTAYSKWNHHEIHICLLWCLPLHIVTNIFIKCYLWLSYNKPLLTDTLYKQVSTSEININQSIIPIGMLFSFFIS